ncbi:MAG: hypothetical protein ACR2NU_15110 [Aeoliella sp.]
MTLIATDNLAELIRKKHQILVQLREIGRRQEQLVGEAQASNLMQLLGAKQHLINALQSVERSLQPFQAEDPDSRLWRSPAQRADCAEQAVACKNLLAEVMELEKRQEIRMTERRDEVASRLKQAGAARQAANAYGLHRSRPASTATFDTAGDLVASDAIDLISGTGST